MARTAKRWCSAVRPRGTQPPSTGNQGQVSLHSYPGMAPDPGIWQMINSNKTNSTPVCWPQFCCPERLHAPSAHVVRHKLMPPQLKWWSKLMTKWWFAIKTGRVWKMMKSRIHKRGSPTTAVTPAVTLKCKSQNQAFTLRQVESAMCGMCGRFRVETEITVANLISVINGDAKLASSHYFTIWRIPLLKIKTLRERLRD